MKKIHKWKIVKDTGKYCYLECKKCGDKAIKEVSIGGYQPIDHSWTEGKRPSIFCKF